MYTRETSKCHNVCLWHCGSHGEAIPGGPPTPLPTPQLTSLVLFNLWCLSAFTSLTSRQPDGSISLILYAHPRLCTGFSLLFTEDLISIPQGDRKPPQPTTMEAVQRQPLWQATDSDGMKSKHFSPERTSSNGKSQRYSCLWKMCTKTVWRQLAKSDSTVSISLRKQGRFHLLGLQMAKQNDNER